MNERRATLDAKGGRFALVAARFNESFVRQLVQGATEGLARLGAAPGDVEVIWVPGSFEIPQIARIAAASGRYDAVIGLGVLIRGATAHFELVAGEAARGLARVSADTGVPAIFGVVTAESLEQAAERTGGKLGNRGWDAAQAAVEMVNLRRMLGASDAHHGSVKSDGARASSRR